MRPLVGISPDREVGAVRASIGDAYLEAIVKAGGLPTVLAHDASLIPEYVASLDAFVIPGGDDPELERFGITTDPRARRMSPVRQAFDLALLDALAKEAPEKPVLGICLGMQLMALHAGGTLDQFLPDVLEDATVHAEDRVHPVIACAESAALDLGGPATVVSRHRQAVRDPGRVRAIARAPDGVLEAIDDPARRFYLGIQWHPERTADERAGLRVYERLVAAARR
ncbi:MAG: gamma-glutamyl-gamma-aminobutyrate hydrolase family protein [Sandaracinus sp.]